MRLISQRYAALIAILGLTVGLGPLAPLPTTAQEDRPGPTDGTLAFITETAGQTMIGLLPAGGTEPRILEGSESVMPGSMAWSPTGDQLVFVRQLESDQSELVVADLASGMFTQISPRGAIISEPSWSPTGSQIAFAADQTGNYDIYTVNPAGNGLLNLTNDPGDDRSPSWSPDGSQLTFSSDREGTSSIYTMSASGAGLTRLTLDDGDDRSPIWSPDGMRIAFLSNRDGNDNVFTVDFNGTNLVRLSETAFDDHDITWSPDGVRVAYTGRPEPMISELFSINADGFDLQQHTADEAQILGSAWSPDGRWLAYSSDRAGSHDLYAVEINGTGWTVLSQTDTSPAIQTYPVWTPAETGGTPRLASEATATPTRQAPPTATPPPATATPSPTRTPTQASATTTFDLLLVYDPAAPSFDLVNVSGRRLDLSGLRFEGNGTAVEALLWNQTELSSSLYDFENNGCLGLWGFDIVAQPQLPAECRHRHGWWQSNNIIFWAGQSFDVYNNGVALATCSTSAGRCEIRLNTTAGTAPPANPTVVPPTAPVTGPGDILLVYDAAVPSLYLVNVSGQRLDISGLVFEGNGWRVTPDIWSAVMSSNIYTFALDGCLGLWGFGNVPQAPPAECGTRQGWIESDRWLFWTAGSFTISLDGVVLATCDTAAGRCLVNLPR